MEDANPVPRADNPDTCESSSGGFKLPGTYPEPNFSPSNHHPDLARSLPSDSIEISRKDCVASNSEGAPLDESSFVETTGINHVENMPITPPLSPRVIPLAANSRSNQEYFSIETDPVDCVEHESWAMACQDYTIQNGIFWDKACLLLEEHFLHPSNLSQREFASLVCARYEDITKWLHQNLSPIVHRTVARWTEANSMLIEAGISPCELRDKFLDEFEYMNHAERMEFIQTYKLIESRVLAAENTLYFTDEQRRAFALMSIVEKYDYITNSATIQAESLPLERSDVIVQADSRQSKVNYLRAEKAGKLRALQSKLHEMRLIENSISELEGPLPHRSASCLFRISEDHELENVDLPSYSDVESYVEVSEQHDHNDSGCNKLAIVRTAPVYRENKPKDNSWEKILPDDPFVDHSPCHDSSTKGNLCHHYGSNVQNLREEYATTSTDSTRDMSSPSSINIPYYDGVEYQDYVDDTWRCYEDSAIPLFPHELKATVTEHTDVKDFAVVAIVTDPTNTKVPDTDLSGEQGLTHPAAAEPLVIFEQARQFAAETRQLAAEMLVIANTVEANTPEVKKQHEQFRTEVKAHHRDSAVCMDVDILDTQPANHDVVGDLAGSLNGDNKSIARKASMSTIFSQSSITSHEEVVLRDVSASKPDMTPEHFATSVHLELMNTHTTTPTYEVKTDAGKDSYDAGIEDVLPVDLNKKKSVRKKLSRFFGSLRNKSLRSKERSSDYV
jgi:hypothetical protein